MCSDFMGFFFYFYRIFDVFYFFHLLILEVWMDISSFPAAAFLSLKETFLRLLPLILCISKLPFYSVAASTLIYQVPGLWGDFLLTIPRLHPHLYFKRYNFCWFSVMVWDLLDSYNNSPWILYKTRQDNQMYEWEVVPE